MNKLGSDSSLHLRFDLRQVRAFLAVASELHFRRAAERLFVSQSALSRSILALENAVGTPLLERSTRQVQLTAAGVAFAEECRQALSYLERASRVANAAAQGWRGHLRIGYMSFAISGSLPVLLRNYWIQFPDVVTDLEYAPSAQQRAKVLDGSIDIGFVIGRVQNDRIRNALLETNDFVALLPDTHRLASLPQLRLADLADEPFILGTEATFSTFRKLLFNVCYDAGFYPNIVQEASNTSGIFGMVAAGIGVSLYAGCARNDCRTGVVVKPLADVIEPIPTFAIWEVSNPSEVLQRFATFVKRYAGAGAVRNDAATHNTQ
ncbi:MAG: LysR family transcriptional regulator [Candidimonas sp.]|nr:MAG: LysR family transcriptional regulator [Candidimonas sp.]